MCKVMLNKELIWPINICDHKVYIYLNGGILYSDAMISYALFLL